MPLGTLDRTPPPFFRQGPSALTKVALCSALALFLMAADTRFELTQPLRSLLATALLPVQRALQWPVELAAAGRAHLLGLQAALGAEDAARVELARLSERAAQVERLDEENARLRALLDLRPALPVRSISAQVTFEAPDPYSRKLFVDRGSAHGVAPGAPAVNEAGVVGQVTRVYWLTSVVTLLSDRDAAIPVLNARTQQRAAAFGGVDGGMELRYVAGNADVEVGDVLYTSGIDGVYPPGLAVGRVTQVERRADSGFARILVRPAVTLDGVRHLLLLEPTGAPQAAEAEAGVPEASAASAAANADAASAAQAKGKGTRP